MVYIRKPRFSASLYNTTGRAVRNPFTTRKGIRMIRYEIKNAAVWNDLKKLRNERIIPMNNEVNIKDEAV